MMCCLEKEVLGCAGKLPVYRYPESCGHGTYAPEIAALHPNMHTHSMPGESESVSRRPDSDTGLETSQARYFYLNICVLMQPGGEKEGEA